MVYNDTDEIFEALATTRRRILELVESVSDAAASTRPAPDRWSLAELVEHLSTTEQRLVGLLTSLLAQEAPHGGNKEPISIRVMTDRADDKFNAPSHLQPTGDAPLSASMAKLRKSRVELLALRPRLEASDYSAVTYPHPAFGPLNVYQWLAAVEFHECRHLAQMRPLREPASKGAAD